MWVLLAFDQLRSISSLSTVATVGGCTVVRRVVGGAVKMIHSLFYVVERTMGYRCGTCPGKEPQSCAVPGSPGDASAGVRIGVVVGCIKRECGVRNDIGFRLFVGFTRGEEKDTFAAEENVLSACVLYQRCCVFS